MTIEELSKKIDKYHEQDIKRAKNYKYQSLGYILFGFAIATSSLLLATRDCSYAVVAGILYIGGSFLLWYSTKFKVK